MKFCKRCSAYPIELGQLNDVKLPITSFHLHEFIPGWHADFVSKMSAAELFELFAASQYLMIDYPLEKLLRVPVSILITVYDSTGKKVLLDLAAIKLFQELRFFQPFGHRRASQTYQTP